MQALCVDPNVQVSTVSALIKAYVTNLGNISGECDLEIANSMWVRAGMCV